jgi:transposase-like protein
VNRWVVKYAPEFEKRFRKKYKRPVGSSWRMDETYIKNKGKWCYLYRAVDKQGNTIDFYLSETRNEQDARDFFDKSMASSGIPEKVNIDKSGSNNAALKSINKRYKNEGSPETEPDKIEIRQCKYLNNIIEQDHRGIKRITNPIMGFGNFDSAKATLSGIEFHRMLKKGQAVNLKSKIPWQQFYEIAA